MKTTYSIAVAIVVIAIKIGSVAAYTYIGSNETHAQTKPNANGGTNCKPNCTEQI